MFTADIKFELVRHCFRVEAQQSWPHQRMIVYWQCTQSRNRIRQCIDALADSGAAIAAAEHT